MADKEKKEKAKTEEGLAETIVDQAITEFTRPTLREIIPPSLLKILKTTGIGKLLPIISIGLSTVAKKYKWGTVVGDFMAEASAELRALINEEVGSVSTGGAKEIISAKATVWRKMSSIIYNAEHAKEEVARLVTAWAELFQDDAGKEKPEKERNQILALVGQMDPEAFYIFLTQEKSVRDKSIADFIKKTTEKPFEEAVKEFKEDVKKLVANAKTIYQEILVPIGQKIKPHLEKAARKLEVAYEQINNDCAEDGPVGREIIAIRQLSENFRNSRRRR